MEAITLQGEKLNGREQKNKRHCKIELCYTNFNYKNKI